MTKWHYSNESKLRIELNTRKNLHIFFLIHKPSHCISTSLGLVVKKEDKTEMHLKVFEPWVQSIAKPDQYIMQSTTSLKSNWIADIGEKGNDSSHNWKLF